MIAKWQSKSPKPHNVIDVLTKLGLRFIVGGRGNNKASTLKQIGINIDKYGTPSGFNQDLKDAAKKVQMFIGPIKNLSLLTSDEVKNIDVIWNIETTQSNKIATALIIKLDRYLYYLDGCPMESKEKKGKRQQVIVLVQNLFKNFWNKRGLENEAKRTINA